MHVLLLHQAFATPKESGGTRHFELAQAAVARGHRVTVVASNFGYLSGTETIPKPREELVEGIRVIRAGTPATGHGGFLGQLYSLVGFAVSSLMAALRVRDVDVVMGTSPSIFQAASAWFVSAVRRKPFLLEIRDLWPEFIIDMGKLRNPVAIWLAHRLEHFLYARADHILVNSPAYVGYLHEHGIRRDEIALIPNGVDAEAFAHVSEVDRRAERARIGARDSAFVAMYAGVMGPANDLETLLRAAELLRDRPDIRVVLVGDGKSRKALEAFAAERSLPNVAFAGSRPKAGMPAALAAADACVATLQNIGMFRMTYPNKVFDYLAAGRPVVLAIDGVIRDVVERAHAGVFVTPGDAGALARAIVTLADDRNAARTMGSRGAVFVREHFNRAAHGAAFSDLLEDVASG